ncbi:MAG: dipeptidase PepE [Bacteroidales bacterium]|jgi:dipeptidase E|nr:dipeptidase PepE [Bacteroidales bacterium]
MIRNLLLISNSTNAGEEYLTWPRTYIQDFLTGFGVHKVLFIPYAGVNLTPASVEKSFDLYEDRVKKIFKEMGFTLNSIHRESNPINAVNEAESIVIGGGNTFHLVLMIQEFGIMEAIRRKVLRGIPFVGWSAGANVACPTMKTTNDMPVCEPPSFNCLKLIPFQINPHYLDANSPGHAGETREQRIMEFLTVNRDTTVAGLREGCILRVEGNSMKLMGNRPLRVFRFGKDPQEFTKDDNLDFLLKITAG